MVPPIQQEAEANDGVSTATPLTLSTNGDAKYASATGSIRTAADLDYFNLGTIEAGKTIFLTSRMPGYSGLVPVVSVYNATNGYMVEAGSGRPFDGVAEVRITQAGTYYAVMRGGNNTGSLLDQYVMDVQVVPTGSVTFPNLQVTAVTTPSGGNIRSGDPATISFTVKNVGSLATGIAGWTDRAVLSLDSIIGNGDDIPLGSFVHSGALGIDEGYTVTTSVNLPDGLSGDYYLLVETDTGNAVNEFLLEGDNVTASAGTFRVNLAPYADFKVEDLAVSGPDASGVFSVGWNTANRGTKAVTGGWKERVFVKNLTTNTVFLDHRGRTSRATWRSTRRGRARSTSRGSRRGSTRSSSRPTRGTSITSSTRSGTPTPSRTTPRRPGSRQRATSRSPTSGSSRPRGCSRARRSSCAGT